MSQLRFDIIKIEDYSHNGVSRSRSWKVGRALEMRRGGFMLFVPEGVSLSGRIFLLPEQHGFAEVDVIEAYASAADEFGL
jgi:hypothetical protein